MILQDTWKTEVMKCAQNLFAFAIDMVHDAIGRSVFPCACIEIGDRSSAILRYWEGITYAQME